jgi:hypothetical protein
MKTYTKYLGLIAASCIAFSGVARAQAITISDDTPSWDGSVINFNKAGSFDQGEGEAITNAIAIQSVTYTFASTQLTSAAGGTLAASLVQWNGTSFGTAAYTTIASLGTVNIPAPDTWTQSVAYDGGVTTVFEQSFNLSFTDQANLNPNDIYAVLLTNTSSTSSLTFGLGEIDSGLSGTGTQDLFDGLKQTGGVNTLNDPGTNWTFSDVSFVPRNNALPAPEPATVAAWAGLILVAGLVFYRLRQQQGADTAPAFARIS